MKKILFIIIALATMTTYSQEDFQISGDWEIFTFVASFEDASKKAQTDTTHSCPVLFKLPDKDNPEELVYIDDYINSYGEVPFFWAEDDTEEAFLQTAIYDYFKSMFNDEETTSPFARIKITYLKDPNNPESKFWVIPNGSHQSNIDYFKEKIITTITEDTWSGLHNETARKAVMLMLPIVDLNEPHGLVEEEGLVKRAFVFYRPNLLNETTAVTAHELGHLLYDFKDNGRGYPYVGKKEGQYLGATYNSSWPFDLMTKGFGYSSSLNKYGITPFHTNDLLNYSPDRFNPQYIEENSTDNKIQVTLKAQRKSIINSTDLTNGVTSAVIVPIEGVDFPEEGERNGEYVLNQRFLIEYWDGTGYSDVSPMYMDGENKGILISHIINDKNFFRTIDIECPNTLPENSRDPSVSCNDEYMNTQYIWLEPEEANGLWYFGKKINDWMDDYAPNDIYTLEGGKNAWWKDPNSERDRSLPTDFFTDEPGRNAFTPMTRPDTRSWKDNETNIAVFIDKIDGDYADLTIYRNYHSTPLTSKTAKTLPDGTKGLTISGDGYIGENFSVGENMNLWIGEGTDLSKTTLIPNTNMVVNSTGEMIVKENALLKLESAKLTFSSEAEFNPYDVSQIVIENSELTFLDGATIAKNHLNYIISVSGVSSFYNSNFDMIGASVLTVNADSRFTLKSGTNIIMSPLSNFTLKAGSELVLEDGVNLVFMDGATVNLEEGSQIVVEGNAKITGNIANAYASITVTDGSTLTLGVSSNLELRHNETTSLNLGLNSEFIVEPNARVAFNPNTPAVCAEGSKITVQGGGTLTAVETKFTGNSSWQGIATEINSNVNLVYSVVNDADWALNAISSNLNIHHSSFNNCENGVKLVNCINYTLNDNYFNGKGTGVAVSLTEVASNIIENNRIQNFGTGVVMITCSPKLISNTVTDNNHYGLYIIGYTSKPMMTSTDTSSLDLNNEIRDNGSNYFEQCSQIYLRYKANIYMEEGRNNIYSGQPGSIPAYPCILTESDISVSSQTKSVEPSIIYVRIDAENNYWGWGYDNASENNIASNFESFFDLYEKYRVSYIEYATEPFEEGLSGPSVYSTLTNDGKDLIKAIQAEEDGKLDLAIKRLEKIVDSNIDLADSLTSEEYYIALAILPDLFVKQEIALDPLVKIFDSSLADEETANKKFFKQMKVSTSIKGKKYDEAIALAEEMKTEAESEGEIMLADIEIEIAKKMKDSNNISKSNRTDTQVYSLIDELTGNEKYEIETPSGITEEIVLPKENFLYQNYPNPFNPITQIKFNLAESCNVRICVYNINGQKIAELLNCMQNAGIHSVNFDGSSLNSGVYYYSLEVKNEKMTRKMLLTK